MSEAGAMISRLIVRLGGVVHLCFLTRRRSAEDVLADLADDASLPDAESGDGRQRCAVQREQYQHRATWIVIGVAVVGARLMWGVPSTIGGFAALFSAAAGVGYVAAEARMRRIKKAHLRKIEFLLPVVMERVVMAVQAGHDVLSAIKVLLDLEERNRTADSRAVAEDAVTALLRKVYSLAESGRGLEQSLQEVASGLHCPALRHAFIHLAQAHREGGELIMPLRELSDATQLYYQETLEEEIAKMPVKATLPLLCTFTGLIILFLTAPLMQVMNITMKAMPR